MTVYYVVRSGKRPDIYIDKREAERQIKDNGLPEVRWFTSLHEALNWYEEDRPSSDSKTYFDDYEVIEREERLELERAAIRAEASERAMIEAPAKSGEIEAPSERAMLDAPARSDGEPMESDGAPAESEETSSVDYRTSILRTDSGLSVFIDKSGQSIVDGKRRGCEGEHLKLERAEQIYSSAAFCTQRRYYPTRTDKDAAKPEIRNYYREAGIHWFSIVKQVFGWPGYQHVIGSGRPSNDDKTIRNMGRKSSSGKSYVVFNGREPGIYHSWAECQEQVNRYSGAQFKSYSDYDSAVDAYSGSGSYSSSASSYSGSSARSSARTSSYPYQTTHARATPSYTSSERETFYEPEPSYSSYSSYTPAASYTPPVPSKKEPLVVHTDGSCRGNGKDGARAGYGVYYGPDHPKNTAKRLEGESQTNQRAELAAISQALEDNKSESLAIRTDSQYAMNCINNWSNTWKQNGWKTAKGTPVENADLVKDIVTKMDQRRADSNVTTEITYVPGHSGVAGNEGADRLANEGAMKPSA